MKHTYCNTYSRRFYWSGLNVLYRCDETIECNGTDNETIANDWNAANILALQSCGTDSCDTDAVFDVTSDYVFTNLTSTCGAGGTILVTYTVADDCGNETILTATLTLEDSIGPDLTSCTVENETIECDGTNNETLADNWNAANILALQSCGTDSCDTDAVFDVTSDYDFTNLVAACGLTGSIEVTYVVKDDCDNATTLTATLTIVDNTAPDATNCVTDQTLDCDGENNEAIADQWNAENIAALEACVTDGCDLDFTGQITSDYNFADLSSAPGLGGMLDVQYIITDDCGNETEVYAMLTLQNNSVSASDITLCNTDELEAQVYDLFDLLNGYYDDSGTWEVISGDATIIDGHYFDPLSITLTGENVGVDIEFSYTENDSACPTYVEASIEVHNRCFVLNCGEDDVEISNAVTPNGDQYNEFFEVSGVELCNYVIDVKIFNRWGALIYESHDYQNNWAGTAHNNSVGGANTVPDGTYYYIVTLKESGIDPINGYIYVGTK
ncbi:gliding motility-associated C-terminal domain-containing protein [Lacinutrix himadriensis]|uniref:gliding motility-associated C-terminal domain-containing protein n=1 Tax=Lacinutrix himadriensis TaxID=641549 RepID=UPI000A695CCA|nr:gliding motility-associated C-terminal domain-containing protein [Lacinutrix himadriensis]